MYDMSIKLPRPTQKYVTCTHGYTSQSTLSLYFLPIEKEMSACLDTLMLPPSLSHLREYGLGCEMVGMPSFLMSVVEATLVQLPPSMIKL